MTLQEKTKFTLTCTTLSPCGIRGIPKMRQHLFSIWTHWANRNDPPLLHKNPTSDPQQPASEAKAILAIGPRGWATSPPVTAVLL